MTNKMAIAVSGAGGGVGQSIIKALYDSDYEIVALDGEPLGTGLFAAATSYVIPYANQPDFVERVIQICQKEACQLFFPGMDAELPVLSQATQRFKTAGITVVVSSPEVIELSDNKLLTFSSLRGAGIPVPQTVDMALHVEEGQPLPAYPFIMKPKIGGARSKDVSLIKNDDELATVIKTLDPTSFVAQQYIEGDEYTCGSVNLNGECQGVIVMRRVLRDGDTYKCFVVKNEVIEQTVREIMAHLKPFGACNVQLRLKDGRPYVFEINARCSGTTAARALCGFNEPKMIADFLLQNKPPTYEIKEQAVMRYWNELVVPNDHINELTSSGELRQEKFTRL